MSSKVLTFVGDRHFAKPARESKENAAGYGPHPFSLSVEVCNHLRIREAGTHRKEIRPSEFHSVRELEGKYIGRQIDPLRSADIGIGTDSNVVKSKKLRRGILLNVGLRERPHVSCDSVGHRIDGRC